MLDLYALPKDFPQFYEAKQIIEPYQRVKYLETAFCNDINDHRFIPYIQLHEFEALILSDPSRLSERFPECKSQVEELSKVCQKFSSPELINDGTTTAPSKRITQFIPGYESSKVSVAPLMVQKIGLPQIRERCPHFNDWLTQLEELSR